MAKGWYVLHTYSGHENKIEKYIRLYMEDGTFSNGTSDKGAVFDVKVPSEEVVEVRNGKKRTVNKKFLPGYILIEMDLPDRGWKPVCTAIRRIQGVMGFVGQAPGSKPQPISPDEARSILQKTGEIKTEKTFHVKQEFVVGEEVKINEGPFESFSGSIEEVFQDKGKLRVIVGIFGRNTPVEVDFAQVERV